MSCLGVSNDGISLCTGSWDSLVGLSPSLYRLHTASCMATGTCLRYANVAARNSSRYGRTKTEYPQRPPETRRVWIYETPGARLLAQPFNHSSRVHIFATLITRSLPITPLLTREDLAFPRRSHEYHPLLIRPLSLPLSTSGTVTGKALAHIMDGLEALFCGGNNTYQPVAKLADVIFPPILCTIVFPHFWQSAVGMGGCITLDGPNSLSSSLDFSACLPPAISAARQTDGPPPLGGHTYGEPRLDIPI